MYLLDSFHSLNTTIDLKVKWIQQHPMWGEMDYAVHWEKTKTQNSKQKFAPQLDGLVLYFGNWSSDSGMEI